MWEFAENLDCVELIYRCRGLLLVRPAVPGATDRWPGQRFCAWNGRRAFHAAARRWALDAIGTAH
jgi:hypothetical protein